MPNVTRIEKSLVALYRRQTADEQTSEVTRYQNGQGFSALDANFGSSLAKQVLLGKELTIRQVDAAERMLTHYQSQLSTIDLELITLPQKVLVDNGTSIPNAPPAKRIQAGEECLEVVFPYDPEMVLKVKTIPGRKWSSLEKRWQIPLQMESVEALLTFAKNEGFALTERAETLVEKARNDTQLKIAASKAFSAELTIPGLGGELMPFQRAGVDYALKTKRLIIGDSMGLGKTVEALATIHAANAYPAIVVCPASVKLNWEREAKKWIPGKSVRVLNGTNSEYEADILVINYDILKKHMLGIKAANARTIVLDESHYCKSHTSLRTKLCEELAKSIEYRLLLSGTPVLNRPQELLSQLSIIDRLKELGGFWNFAKRYCNAQHTKYGWDFSGSSNLSELNLKMRGCCYLRRVKEEVLKELPAKRRAIVPLTLSNEKEYRKVENDLKQWLLWKAENELAFLNSIKDLPEEEQRRLKKERLADTKVRSMDAEQLVKIEALKQIAASGKLEAAKEWIASFLETGEKLVIFAWHQAVVENIAGEFKAPSITGSTSIEERQKAIDRFQTDPTCNLIVANMQAGGVGITLTAASNVAFLELGWTPAVHDQAEDRVHRIGQTESVTAWYLLAAGTIDEYVCELLDKKRTVVTAATDGKEVEEVKMLNELVGRFLK